MERELIPGACARAARRVAARGRAAASPRERRRVTREGARATHQQMEAETALRWLRDVKGQLYCNRRHPSGRRAWVAVVRTPAQGTHRARLIIALGSTMEEAAAAAEDQWQQVFAGLSHSH